MTALVPGIGYRVIRAGLAALLGVVLFAASAQAQEKYSPYQSIVHKISSAKTGGDYNVYVGLPRDYGTGDKDYPVLFLQDGDYSFPIAQSVVLHLSDRDDLPQMIVVAIASQGGIEDLATYRRNRTRDFTPTFSMEGGYGPNFQEFSGGANNYGSFLANELQPFIEQKYRVDTTRWTYVGHSYGGLFGAYVLLNRTHMFTRYILVSPSLWYDETLMLREAVEKAPLLHNAHAKVFMAVGADESPLMSEHLLKFAELVDAGAGGGVSITTKIFDDENHNSVFPIALTRGLRVLFDPPVKGGEDQTPAQ